MTAYGESKFWQYPSEERERYCIYSEHGYIIGVKEEAPEEFKEAYAAEEERERKWAELGID